jgi:probable phosphoglycerate mutase
LNISSLLKHPRRRIYLMRHGSVDYFRADGSAIPPHGVGLNEQGRVQADAAGAVFAAAGVRFDKVMASGLPRTLETARRVLAAAGQSIAVDVDERLQEIRPGRLADIPREELAQAFLGAFSGIGDVERHRFLGGESVGELLDRVLPAFESLLADGGWHDLLLVLHGGVNRALISRVLAGSRAFFGRMEQAPACINIIDAGANDLVLRGVNLAPTQWLHERERHTTMEKLLAQYLRLDQAS